MTDVANEGTQEWTVDPEDPSIKGSNLNFFYGCRNGCLYCYALRFALRFKRVLSYNEWLIMRPNEDVQTQGFARRGGIVMLPSSHDLFPEEQYYKPALRIIRNLLLRHNRLLIVSKPNPTTIAQLLEDTADLDRSKIHFRFTITTANEATRQYWEPYAPTIAERIASARLVAAEDLPLSFSLEPLLDEDPQPLLTLLGDAVGPRPCWIGHMTGKPALDPEARWPALKAIQSPAWARALIARYLSNPHIRIKSSLRKHASRK